jgi:hypothetical protein
MQFNERPYLLSLFTHGSGATPDPGLVLDDSAVLCTAVKAADTGEGTIVRLFNPTAKRQAGSAKFASTYSVPYDLGPYEVRTYHVTVNGQVAERSIVEGALGQ